MIVGGKCIMFIALLATRNKNSQASDSTNPKTQQTSLWFRLVVLLLSIRSYPLRLGPAPGVQRSFLAASSFGNQLGQPLLLLPNQAQILQFELVLMVNLAVPFYDLGLTHLLEFGDQKLFRRDG